MTVPICPCDGATLASPVNPPALPHIAYRIGTFREFRRALLTPLDGEAALSRDGLPIWRTDGAGDLAVMMAEWFAYLADILTFYNERIANQDYLRTADLPESVPRLIRLLGYRPRPAIGAIGTLAALVTPGQSSTLPKGLQFQSKPAPGQAPQIFELGADTAIGEPDLVPAAPPPHLLSQGEVRVYRPYTAAVERFAGYRVGRGVLGALGFGGSRSSGGGSSGLETRYGLLLNGAITTVAPQARLLLRPRDPARGDPLLATVATANVVPAPGGGHQTSLTFSLSDTPPTGLTAAEASLERSTQAIGVWSVFSGAFVGSHVHLASLARQIRPGDWIALSGGPSAPDPAVFKVTRTGEAVWDATGTADQPTTPKDANHPVPLPHTVLTLSPRPDGWDSDAGSVTVAFSWVGIGPLLDQPFTAWDGASTLLATGATTFAAGTGVPILLQDSGGIGIAATGTSEGGTTLQVGTLPAPLPLLQPPFSVLYNLLPVTRGKTVANEVLGSGDATQAGQSFTLAQSPVTYLSRGAGYASTIELRVNGVPWTEVASFYGQPANARVFVTREDENGRTHVDFGDGVDGARLPTGANNVIATYRIGAGVAAPPAGKLTVIAKSYPGLRAVLNPLAVGGGADAEPSDQIRRYAPRSVLTLGRAVSVFDYQALAAQAPGVSRAAAVWAWDDARQRTVVTVYVGDDAAAATSAGGVLASAGDPNRPVKVVQATAIAATLSLTVIVTPGMDAGAIAAGITAALTDPESGLFAAVNLTIGQTVFDSQIETAVLGVRGAVAIATAAFTAGGAADPGPLHRPGEGGYYTLAAADVQIVTEPDPHGG